MKNTINLIKRYSLVSFLFFLCTNAWGQAANNLKHLISKNNPRIPTGNYEGISTQLAMHPETKAFLNKVAQEGKSKAMGNYDAFVGIDHQVYLLDLTNEVPQTNTKQLRFLTDKLGTDIQWHKVAVNKDFTRFALLTYPYEPLLIVYDLLSDTFSEFEIYNPSSLPSPEFVDLINFDPTGEYIIYDAYNKKDSGKNYWDIGIIKVWNTTTNNFGNGSIKKPFINIPDGYSYSTPVFSNLSTDLIAFEEVAEAQGLAKIILYNIRTGQEALIATNHFYRDYSLVGAPCFSPTDDYIAYVTDEGKDRNYVSLQQIARCEVQTVGSMVDSTFDECPIWYLSENTTFNVQEAQLSSFVDADDITFSY